MHEKETQACDGLIGLVRRLPMVGLDVPAAQSEFYTRMKASMSAGAPAASAAPAHADDGGSGPRLADAEGACARGLSEMEDGEKGESSDRADAGICQGCGDDDDLTTEEKLKRELMKPHWHAILEGKRMVDEAEVGWNKVSGRRGLRE